MTTSGSLRPDGHLPGTAAGTGPVTAWMPPRSGAWREDDEHHQFCTLPPVFAVNHLGEDVMACSVCAGCSEVLRDGHGRIVDVAFAAWPCAPVVRDQQPLGLGPDGGAGGATP